MHHLCFGMSMSSKQQKLFSKWNKTNADAISKMKKKKHQETLPFKTGVIYMQKCVKPFKLMSLLLTIPISIEINTVPSWFIHILFWLLCADLILGFLFCFFWFGQFETYFPIEWYSIVCIWSFFFLFSF